MGNGVDTIIRPINPDDSLEALTHLLHRSYSDLAKMGFKFLASHQPMDETQKRICAGSCYVADLDGNVVGTITWRRGKKCDGPPEIYSRPEVAIFGQFGVEPHLQRRGIGRQLLDCVEKDARNKGCELIALDTAEGATHLIGWYSRLGFRFLEYVKWDVTNYRSVIMAKSLG